MNIDVILGLLLYILFPALSLFLDSRLKILINEWSEIFDSNWALKSQRKWELRFARQVISEIFKAKLNRE